MNVLTTIRRVYHRFREIVRNRSLARFNLDKKNLIDYAFTKMHPKPESFADLGGVWRVDAVYTFYTLDHYEVKSAFLVDTDINETVVEKSRAYENLTLLNGNFGDKALLDQIGEVDVLYLFDVLLHQVNPDWDEILAMCAPITRCMVIYNPQFLASDTTVRLLDLGEEEYFNNVPRKRIHPLYQDLFEKMNEIHPQHGRIWRDIHNVWQWGIVDDDLRAKMEGLGFKEYSYKNCGQFGALKNFENHAFVFIKD